MFIWGELFLLLFFCYLCGINLFICDHEPACQHFYFCYFLMINLMIILGDKNQKMDKIYKSGSFADIILFDTGSFY
jgi:hypothetical protein